MKRDDIYDHLAQVYLGKRSQKDDKRQREYNAWLVINIFITVIIFSSAFYGLTAFLTHRNAGLESRVIYSLHQGPIRFDYNFSDEFPPVKTFTLDVPAIDAAKYGKIKFSIRGKEEGAPGIVKVVLKNRKNEEASYYIRDVGLDWQEFKIPFEDFEQITDWSSLTEISFVLESWNVENRKGLVLIDGICFSS